jgi:hypothetical protein
LRLGSFVIGVAPGAFVASSGASLTTFSSLAARGASWAGSRSIGCAVGAGSGFAAGSSGFFGSGG